MPLTCSVTSVITVKSLATYHAYGIRRTCTCIPLQCWNNIMVTRHLSNPFVPPAIFRCLDMKNVQIREMCLHAWYYFEQRKVPHKHHKIHMYVHVHKSVYMFIVTIRLIKKQVWFLAVASFKSLSWRSALCLMSEIVLLSTPYYCG